MGSTSESLRSLSVVKRFMPCHVLRKVAIVMVALFNPILPVTTRGDVVPLAIEDTDRILILAPHPDDEILGCGGIIQRAVARKQPLRVVFLTNGDFNERSFAVYRRHFVVEPRAVLQMGKI